jgi:hypothetical protein
MWRSFSPLRTGESRLTPDSPDSASILSVRSKNGSLQRPTALQAGKQESSRTLLEQFKGGRLGHLARTITQPGA